MPSKKQVPQKAKAKPVKKTVSKAPPKAKAKAKPVKKTVVKAPKKAAPKASKPAKAKPVAAKQPVAKNRPPAALPRPTPVKLTPFLEKQRGHLLALKDTLLDSMNGVAKDSLRSRAEGSEASAFGMHQADAGSDAYDRDFALSLLSQEQDSLYEIDQALKRIDMGLYGNCEMSGKPIPHARLEALPFTRYTVECQADLEKRNRFSRVRQPVTSLFGLSDEEGDGDDDDSSSSDSKE